MNWLKLTPTQQEAIAALNATNPSNILLSPTRDSAGAAWIRSDALTEPLFAHYASVLSELTPTDQTPEWPAEETL